MKQDDDDIDWEISMTKQKTKQSVHCHPIEEAIWTSGKRFYI